MEPNENADWEERLLGEPSSRSSSVFTTLGVMLMAAGVVMVALGAKAAISLLFIGVPLTIYGVKLSRRGRHGPRRRAEISGAFIKRPHRGEPFWSHRGKAFGSRDQTA